MPVASPPNPLRPLSPEESRLFDLYVDAESDFLAFRNAAGLSSTQALEFLRSIPQHLEALDTQLSSAWNRFTISRKTNVIRVLEQVIAENRDNPVERRRAATAILRAIHPPRQRGPESPTFTPSPVQPGRVPSSPPRERSRDPLTAAVLAGADLATLLAKVKSQEAIQDQVGVQPRTQQAKRPPLAAIHRQPPPTRSHSPRPHSFQSDNLANEHAGSPSSPLPDQQNLPSTPTPPQPSAPKAPATSSAKLASLAGSAPRCRDPAA